MSYYYICVFIAEFVCLLLRIMSIDYIRELIADGADEPTFNLTSNTTVFGVPYGVRCLDCGGRDKFLVKNKTSLSYVFAFICKKIAECVERHNHLEYLDFSGYLISSNVFYGKHKIHAMNKFIILLTALSKSSNFKVLVLNEKEKEELKNMVAEYLKNTTIQVRYSEYASSYMIRAREYGYGH